MKNRSDITMPSCAVRTLVSAAFLLSLALLATPVLFGQMRAQISGSISDASGAKVPNAQITLTNVDTGTTRKAVSNSEGLYLIPLLEPGNYKLTVSHAGFRPVTREGITLQVAQAIRLDLELQVGAAKQTVEVRGHAPLLDASSSTIGQVVSSQMIANLPTNGRNSYSFVALVPGVRAPRGFTQAAINHYNNEFVSINGSRPNENLFYLDGGNNSQSNFNGPTYTPPMDTVREYKVQTNNFSAEYANAAGGVVNVVTKSGTNQFHGDLYDFLRNNALDAGNFFANRAGLKNAPFRFNQFGGTLGGPITKNKTFFFFGYEALRESSRSVFSGTMPTAAQRQGDFSSTYASNGQLITIYDPLTTAPDPANPGSYTRTAFTGNIIPPSRLDPVAMNLVKLWPASNTPGNPVTGVDNFVSNESAHTTTDNVTGRVDHNFSDNTSAFVRFSHSSNLVGAPDIYGNVATPNVGNDRFTGWNGAVSVTHIFGPKMFMGFSSAYNRYTLNRRAPGVGFDPTQLGFPSYLVANSQLPAFPGISISGTAPLGNSLIAHHGYDRFEERVDFTRVSGKQTWKFGGVFGVPRQNADNPIYADGQFSFSPGFTQGPNPLVTSSTAGYGFASFLLGAVSGGHQNTKRVGMASLNRYMGGYFEDDIKVASRLTLNLGIRYDYTTPFTERYNQIDNFNFTAVSKLPNGVSVTGGPTYLGVNGNPRGAWNNIYNNVSPRFGFAYDMGNSTVIRGGYGIFYAQMNGGGYNADVVPNFGFNCVTTMVTSIDGGLTPFNYLSDPFPSGFCQPSGSSLGLLTGLGQSVDFMNRNLHTPMTQQWNIDVQRRLAGNLVFEIAYSGTRGEHLFGNFHYNQLPIADMALGSQLLQKVSNPFYGQITTGPLSNSTVTQGQLLVPYPQFQNVNATAESYGDSNYHAMQVKLQKRFSHGLTFLAAYTFSKSIDDVGATTTGFPGEAFTRGNLQNYLNLHAERALSVFDTPQNFELSYVWMLPFGSGHRFLNQPGLMNRVLGGWQINGITTFLSGAPLQITGGSSSHANGSGTQRPNWNGQNGTLSGPIENRLDEYFKTSVFSANAPFTFGTAPRTMPDLRAPGARNFDFSLFKNASLTERLRLQFRAEFFNIFNTPQFGFPGTGFGSRSFGVISSQANSPRDIQFALKLLF